MATFYLLRGFGLILLGLMVYAQTFHFGFVFDDYIFIVNNSLIKNLNNIHLIWQSFPMTRLIGMYSFAFNYALSQLNASSYHIFNFIVHICSAVLVWAISQLLFKLAKIFPDKDARSRELPFLIALLFVVHPGQTQAITYITQRFESLATMFYLATVYFYLQARIAVAKRWQLRYFGLVGVFTILGILTKEVVITLPVMLGAIEWIFFPGKNKKRFWIALSIVMILLYVLFTKLVHGNLSMLFGPYTSASHDGETFNLWGYLLTEMRVFLTFLRLLILPLRQALDYDYPASTDLFHPPLTCLGVLVMGCFVALIVRLRTKQPIIAFGLSWILITFSINMAPRINVIFEHKLYLISFGFFLVLVTILSLLIKNPSTLFKILYSIVIVLAVVAFERNRVWASELTLWQENVKAFPNKARVNANLGRAYSAAGNQAQAIYYLSRAIDLKPDNISYENRGIIYGNIGQENLALQDLNHAIAMEPGYSTTYIKRGWIFQKLNQYPAAIDDLNHAISLDPYSSDAYIQRGMCWMVQNQRQKALDDFQHALQIDPLNSQAQALIQQISR